MSAAARGATPIGRVLDDVVVTSLAQYTELGGGDAFAASSEAAPTEVIELLRASGLRGRGGAGFPVGAKWSSVRAGGAEVGRRYVVANGAEGEPGTFKDRSIIRRNPYRLIEGVLVAAVVMGADEAYIAVKRSFTREIARLERAIEEMAADGWLADVHVHLVLGPDDYLFGEEKALLEVIEGNEPLPRQLPPYMHGLFAGLPSEGWNPSTPAPHPDAAADATVVAGSNPTLVNNVETLSYVPLILRHGAEWFRSCGTDASPGTVVCTVSGDTRRAGVVEVEMGAGLADVIALAGGGLPDGRHAKGVLSGVANAVIVGDGRDVEVSYEGFEVHGSGLGAAGFVVYDDRRDMVRVAHAVSDFLATESCGQCSPCKLGSLEVTERLGRLMDDGGSPQDLDRIAARLRTVTDANRCFLGRQEQVVVASLLQSYPADVALHVSGVHTAPVPKVAKIVDIADGVARLDDHL